MSQHKVRQGTIEYVYGYDPPLQEYFLQAYDLTKKEDEEDCIYSIGSYYTTMYHPKYPGKRYWSNGELMEFIKQENYPIKEQHLALLAADLPF